MLNATACIHHTKPHCQAGFCTFVLCVSCVRASYACFAQTATVSKCTALSPALSPGDFKFLLVLLLQPTWTFFLLLLLLFCVYVFVYFLPSLACSCLPA